ncbi:hypothetical protein BEWA_012510 [Theileria equi strain WA]|uniref:PUB domain-containing protein n=1 Tax=Theileria equi strain WA TaxID=1537102 RepID=L1LB78_THEEQ|nr:hypothetical protein BEWA_012510 [Theileria equi strain WA]EKX72692.1 hypothetical protein BEWA_012510 [Theileria equi strain WA]|eukprot:XP_004832144.1 hypothetical protein BEWA_012510 [Theileria equi strain WA]
MSLEDNGGPGAGGSEITGHSGLFDVDVVEYVQTPEDIYPFKLNELFDQLKELPNDEIKRSGSMFLLKILENILLNPRNHNVRRIRESNPVFVKNTSKHELFLKLLKSFGFTSIDGNVVLQIVDVPRLLEAYRQIIKILLDGFNVKYKSLEAHFFDPFKAYCHNSNVNANVHAQQFEMSKKDEIDLDLKEKSRQISEPESSTRSLEDWNPKIYIETKVSPTNKLPSEESPNDGPSASIMKMYNVGKNENFESRSKNQLKILDAQAELLKKCPNVQIKIRFPGSTIMIIQPPIKTLVHNIRKQIQTILSETISFDHWYLTEMPIKRKINDNKTLIQEDIVYKAVLHFCYSKNIDAKSQIIKQEYLTKFLAKE